MAVGRHVKISSLPLLFHADDARHRFIEKHFRSWLGHRQTGGLFRDSSKFWMGIRSVGFMSDDHPYTKVYGLNLNSLHRCAGSSSYLPHSHMKSLSINISYTKFKTCYYQSSSRRRNSVCRKWQLTSFSPLPNPRFFNMTGNFPTCSSLPFSKDQWRLIEGLATADLVTEWRCLILWSFAWIFQSFLLPTSLLSVASLLIECQLFVIPTAQHFTTHFCRGIFDQ